MLCSCPQCINANQWSASAIWARITRLRHPAPSTCRSDPTFLVFESKSIEPNNSIEDGANATKDLISVPLMTRKVRLHNEQYCVSDVGANVSNTRHQSVMVARAPCSPSSQTRPGTRCVMIIYLTKVISYAMMPMYEAK